MMPKMKKTSQSKVHQSMNHPVNQLRKVVLVFSTGTDDTALSLALVEIIGYNSGWKKLRLAWKCIGEQSLNDFDYLIFSLGFEHTLLMPNYLRNYLDELGVLKMTYMLDDGLS